ncbi:hypothetical protein KM043_008594 [Ampulex compressa]|nr:hypothetical protein KM043_008594 [Ampulex compressa]
MFFYFMAMHGDIRRHPGKSVARNLHGSCFLGSEISIESDPWIPRRPSPDGYYDGTKQIRQRHATLSLSSGPRVLETARRSLEEGSHPLGHRVYACRAFSPRIQ